MEGNILEELIYLSGLPKGPAEDWISRESRKRGLDPQTLTLDQIRVLLEDLFVDLIIEAPDAPGRPG